jgi:hypothetical protein
MDKCSRCDRPTTRLWLGRPRCEACYQHEVKDAAAREERAQARKHRDECRRCGAPLEEGYDVICMKCDYDDWHEEIPDVYPEEDSDAS